MKFFNVSSNGAANFYILINDNFCGQYYLDHGRIHLIDRFDILKYIVITSDIWPINVYEN